MSISNIITRGYGTFSELLYVVTRGYLPKQIVFTTGTATVSDAALNSATLSDRLFNKATIGDVSLYTATVQDVLV